MTPKTTKTQAITTMLFLALTGGRAMAAPPPPSPRAGALQRDVLAVLTDTEKKILALEGAVPRDKFDWRPAPGVRSVSEAYLHIAFANYNMTRIATGRVPPADAKWDLDRTKWDSQTTDKAKIKAVLERSFSFAHDAINALPDADLDKTVDFFGHRMTARAVLLMLVGHDNEHLGQSVAYARANKVVPPWSQGAK
jgi:uncharacterized damage-inducible protein DinB